MIFVAACFLFLAMIAYPNPMAAVFMLCLAGCLASDRK